MAGGTVNKYIIFYNGKQLWLDPEKVTQHPPLQAVLNEQAPPGIITVFGDDRAIQLFGNWVHYGDHVLSLELQRCISGRSTSTPELSASYEKMMDVFGRFNLLTAHETKTFVSPYDSEEMECNRFMGKPPGYWGREPTHHVYNCSVFSKQ
jgi:hypothetical protein